MKIGLDLRFIDTDNIYSNFVLELVNKLILVDKQNVYNLYLSKKLNLSESRNTKVILENNKNNSLKNSFLFSKKLKKDKNTLMIFFEIKKPILFKGDYIVFTPTLKDIYYQNFENYIQKYKFLYFLNDAIKKANRIICFEQGTKDELNERFNIEESKVSILPAFFPKNDNLTKNEDIKIDLKVTSNIKNDFFIYSSGSGIEKNLERLINIFKRFRDENKALDLVVLCEEASRNLDIRRIVVEHNMQENIHFLGDIEDRRKVTYYNNSLGVILPSLYEPFPFKLAEAVFFNAPIIASNSSSIKNIFKESITYFSPISVSDMKKNIEDFLKKQSKTNYEKTLNQHNPEVSANKLIEIINNF